MVVGGDSVDRIDNGNLLTQVGSDDELFLGNTKLYDEKQYQLFCVSASLSLHLIQIGHTAMFPPWRDSVKDYRSFRFTPVDLVRVSHPAHFCLHLVCGHTNTAITSTGWR